MFYKMLVLDIDGTLLNPTHQLPDENLHALRRYQQRGGMVALATGKLYHAIEGLCRTLGLKIPQIIGNGYVIVSPQGEMIECMGYLTQNQKQFARETFKAARLDYVFYGAQNIWYETGKAKRSDLQKLVALGEIEPEPLPAEEFNNLDNVIKVLAFCDENDPKEQAAREAVNGRSDLWLYRSSYQFIEIARAEINKGLALRRLMDLLKIDPGEVAVVGDNENDLGMFAVAGLSVAMGQSADSVKEKADIVTASNEDAGVARFLEDYGLI